jgi:hypothetical protein
MAVQAFVAALTQIDSRGRGEAHRAPDAFRAAHLLL